MDPHRIERLTESVREELDELIGYELSDPRIGQVTVTQVQLSPDLRHAQVHLALSGSVEEQNATLEAINHAKQFLRHNLAERLELHHTPELHFMPELSPQLGAKAAQVLRRIRRGRAKG